jgi:flavodoxin
MRILVAYYSLSGVTRRIATRAAGELGADIVEIKASRYKPTFFGFLRAASDSWSGRLPAIDATGGAPHRYDFTLVLAPVWAGHAATPIRAYLSQYTRQFKRAAFLLTCGGNCPKSALDEMANLAGAEPEATFVATEKELKDSSGWPAQVAAYVAALAEKKAA